LIALHFIFKINFAVVFTTAFFLHAQNKPTVKFLSGKVELVDSNQSGEDAISILEINSSIESNHIVASGKGSRTELETNEAIWRLGSKSLCKWISNNECWLHSGSLLYSSDIKSSIIISSISTRAVFEGTGTIIIETTSNGGFKFIPLEGSGTLSTEKGGSKKVVGGRLILVMSNPSQFGDAFDIDLLLMLKSSRLLNSFPDTLPRVRHIGMALYVQQVKLKGKYDALIGDATTEKDLQMWKFGSENSSDTSKSEGLFNKIFNR
jgi:hypothetical protein